MQQTPKTIVITGCSTGIGRALCLELASRGQRVFATARRPEVLADIETSNLTALALDVTDETSIRTAIDLVLASAGSIDILINNAGINAVGPLMELPLVRAREMFETNVLGLLAVSQAVFPHMAERRRGRIVNIGSIVHLLSTPFGGAYAATKAAVHRLSEALRMEVAPFGIEVVEVQPGAVRSNIADTAARGVEQYGDPASAYHFAHQGIVRRAHASQENPMKAEQFAARLADRILSPRTARVLRIGGGVHTLPLVASLPQGALEALLMRRFGLDTRDVARSESE